MIFHATALSSYSAKVRLVLCVKGIEFEERAPKNGYRSAEYRALVPMGTMPAIQEGDWVLSESEAINEYLEERYPSPPMLRQQTLQQQPAVLSTAFPCSRRAACAWRIARHIVVIIVFCTRNT